LAEEFIIEKSLPDDKKYEKFLSMIKTLLSRNDNFLSNLSNFTAAIKQTFEKISWAGFYMFDGAKLYLGPFQGKIACTSIELGKGVCGNAALHKKSIIVPDVDKFPGHISCDSESKSEIVIPIIKKDKSGSSSKEILLGVLDLDSTSFNSFNETDKKYLELLCIYLAEEIF
jgi:GAF domain-containing protein